MKHKTWVDNLLSKIGKEKRKFNLEEEIESIINTGKEKGFIDQRSCEMIQSVLALRGKMVREVVVPRTEIIAVSSDSAIEDVLGLVSNHGHTRMPVYDGSVDNIIGILNAKDLLRFWAKPPDTCDISSILREAYYIPETKNIHLLLHELKEKKSHMAIVIDEYGGTAGLVTLEDLIEEIVGEIHDEHDVEENAFTVLANGDVLVDSRVEIEEFEEYFGVEIPEGKFETLGGLIFHIIRKIPIPGEVVCYDNFEMVIESADERRIKKIRIRAINKMPKV
ncbi:MAG: HlyC/CorC family transporter [Syntrophobacterales bacterium]|nr:HlyC/CorC family transporter [Syntrophobacterales bacterium]